MDWLVTTNVVNKKKCLNQVPRQGRVTCKQASELIRAN